MNPFAVMIRRYLFRIVAVVVLSSSGLCALSASNGNGSAQFAVAVNPAYVGYFIVTGERSSATARNKALRLCKKATGADCELIMASQGGFLALGYSPSGNLRLVVESAKERAAADFDEECRTEYAGSCSLEQMLDLSTRAQIIEASGPRRFAALAFGVSDHGSGEQDGRVWLVSGKSSAGEAASLAMQRCNAALGEGKCRSQVTSGQTHIALYRSSDGRSGGMQINLSQQLVIGAVDRICRQDGISCELIALAAAQDPRDQEYDLYRMKGVPL